MCGAVIDTRPAVARGHERAREAIATPPSIRGVNPLLLGGFSTLASVETDELERLARDTESYLVPKGQTLFSQGDPADAVYLVLDGAVRLEHQDPDGQREDHEAFGLNASFGDVVLTGETSRHYTATTTARTLLLRLPLETLRDVLARHPEIASLWAYSVTGHLTFKKTRLTGSLRRRLEAGSSTLLDAA